MQKILFLIMLLPVLGFAETKLTTGINEFGFDLFKKMASAEEGNIFFSPYSISSALSMTSAGARGQTLSEMQHVLHLPANPHNGFQDLQKELTANSGSAKLWIANSVWAEKADKYKPAFENIVKNQYAGQFSGLDFRAQPEQSRKTINDWTEKKTEQRIKDILPQGAITPSIQMVLTNAIYFKAPWTKDFDKSATKEDSFYLKDEWIGRGQKTLFMHKTGDFSYAEDGKFQMLILDYKESPLSFIVLLPKKKAALKNLERDLTAKYFSKLYEKRELKKVIVSLPKFKFESSYKLSSNLKELGMPQAFGKNADFGNIKELSPGDVLNISEVFHKTFIQVDEEGTEAAAATAVAIMVGSALMEPEKPIEFNANHPFAYMIYHWKTDAILFMGRYAKPAPQKKL